MRTATHTGKMEDFIVKSYTKKARTINTSWNKSIEVHEWFDARRVNFEDTVPHRTRPSWQVIDPETACRALIKPWLWNEAMQVLGASMALAYRYAPNQWGLRVSRTRTQRGFYSLALKVGAQSVLELREGSPRVFLLVDRDSVPMKIRRHREVWFSSDSDFYGHTGNSYRLPAGAEACVTYCFHFAHVYPALFESHAQGIARAAKGTLHPALRQSHAAELVRFVGEQIGKTLPQPAYYEGCDSPFVRLLADEQEAQSVAFEDDSL